MLGAKSSSLSPLKHRHLPRLAPSTLCLFTLIGCEMHSTRTDLGDTLAPAGLEATARFGDSTAASQLQSVPTCCETTCFTVRTLARRSSSSLNDRQESARVAACRHAHPRISLFFKLWPSPSCDFSSAPLHISVRAVGCFWRPNFVGRDLSFAGTKPSQKRIQGFDAPCQDLAQHHGVRK